MYMGPTESISTLFLFPVKCLPAGLEPNAENTECVLCDVGYFKVEGATRCSECPENYTTADRGSTNQTKLLNR